MSGATTSVDGITSRPSYDFSPPQFFFDAAPAAVPASVYNVRDYGAVGNGTADDRAAIQAAIDAAHAAGGGVVYLPAGTYGVTGQAHDYDGALQLEDNVFLKGAGMGQSVIRLIDGWHGDIHGIVRSPSNEITTNYGLADVTIDGNRANTDGHVYGFYCGVLPGDPRADEDVYVLRVEATNNSGYGFDPHARTERLLMQDNIADHNGLDGFTADFQIDAVFSGNLAYANDRHGFQAVTSSNDILFLNNVAHDNGSAGLMIQRGSENIPEPYNIVVRGGAYEDNAREGIAIRLAHDVQIDGVMVSGNGTNGIGLYGAEHITIQGSHILDSSQAAGGVYSGVNIDSFNDTDGAGGAIFASQDVYVTDNEIRQTGDVAFRAAVKEHADAPRAEDTLVVGNQIDGGPDPQVALYGPGSAWQQNGTDAPEQYVGGNQPDQISGGGGDDTIDGGQGADILLGEAGNDLLSGGNAPDWIDGGTGSDTLDGGTSADTLFGGADADSIAGGSNADVLSGGDGPDTMDGGVGADSMDGGDGTDSMSGSSGDDSVIGDNGDDTMSGGSGQDTLDGGDGADSMEGASGNDSLTGGAGNDTMTGDSGDDVMDGGGDRDSMSGGSGNDTMEGGDERDTMTGGSGNDWMDGGEDRDIMRGDNGADTMYGAGGDDDISGRNGDDYIDGGDGNDDLTGDNGADTIYGANGEDTFDGGNGNDLIDGGDGNDVMAGGAGTDTMLGGEGGDTLSGEVGADNLSGGNGDDVVAGDAGNDKLFGEAGNDALSGGDGNDTLYGGSDNDSIAGDAGDDKLYGDGGNDIVDGGAGNDVLTGGADEDTFVFNVASSNGIDMLDGNDTITDIQPGVTTEFLEFHDDAYADALLSGGQAAQYMDEHLPGGVAEDGLGNTVITWSNGETTTLHGVSDAGSIDSFADLQAHDILIIIA